jgi:sulfur carrier protein ThiS
MTMSNGGRGRALLLVAAHVQAVVVGPAVRQPVDQPGVAVVGEDHRLVRREHRVELRVGEPVRVLALGLQSHEVDDVDHPHLELWQMLAQQRRRGQRLERRHVPGARQHDVRLAALVAARPFPDPEPARAVDDRFVHRQAVERGLLAGHDDVHVVAAAQAVVAHRQQAVGVRRQVDADDVRVLVDRVVDEAGVLVGESRCGPAATRATSAGS